MTDYVSPSDLPDISEEKLRAVLQSDDSALGNCVRRIHSENVDNYAAFGNAPTPAQESQFK